MAWEGDGEGFEEMGGIFVGEGGCLWLDIAGLVGNGRKW